MVEAQPAAGGEITHERRLGTLVWAGAFFAVCGVVIGWAPVSDVWRSGHAPNPAGLLRMALASASFVFVAVALAGLLLKRPRLSIAGNGVSLVTLFRNSSAGWSSLGPFELTTVWAGRRKKPIQTASARIVGAEVSPGLRGKPRFSIPDAFVTPIEAIVAELNARLPETNFAMRANPEPDEASFGIANFGGPWVTVAIISVLATIFVLELIFAIEPSGTLGRQGLLSLLAFGALDQGRVVVSGEWYRLFTAPLLHLDLLHLFFNCVALLIAGISLERLVGRAWFFALFSAGALGGSLMSLAVNPPTLISVGASGAIMALLAAAYALSFRLPAGRGRQRMQIRSLQILIPSMLPLASNTGATQIDYGAHVGGALVGIAISLFLLRTWPAADRLPRFMFIARGVAGVGLLLFVGSSAATVGNYPAYRALVDMMPAAELPATDDAIQQRGTSLAKRYPKDPRAHYFHALVLIHKGDNAGAEQELRTTLDLTEPVRLGINRRFDNAARVVLAAVLEDEGKMPDARAMARVVCIAPAAEQPAADLMKFVSDQHLCE